MSELAPIIGSVIERAFFDDRDFRETLRPLLEQLGLVARRAASGQDYPLSIALDGCLNSYFVSSYHASRAIESLADAGKNAYREQDLSAMNVFMTLMHSFALEAVLNLASARVLLTNVHVADAVGVDATIVSRVFSEHFENLQEARNSLAHDEERVLRFRNGKRLDTELEKIQLKRMEGPYLDLRFPDGQPFTFAFPSKSYLGLLHGLRKLVCN